jgi:hypothetical protein
VNEAQLRGGRGVLYDEVFDQLTKAQDEASASEAKFKTVSARILGRVASGESVEELPQITAVEVVTDKTGKVIDIFKRTELAQSRQANARGRSTSASVGWGPKQNYSSFRHGGSFSRKK